MQLSLLVLCAAPVVLAERTPSKQNDTFSFKKGKYSKVKLLQVSKTQPCDSQATNALQFIVLVQRLPSVKGIPSLVEPRDFTINGQSYRQFTKAASGRYFEPHTILNDVARIKKFSPSLKIPTGAGDEDFAIVTEIDGGRFPPGDIGNYRFEMGFDKKTDVYNFAFKLSELDVVQRNATVACVPTKVAR